MTRSSLGYRDALRLTRDLRCPKCGLAIGQAVTAWKGRGAGDGGRHFRATQVEPAVAVCQCPLMPNAKGE